ncbi:MAG: hypothetical protein LUH02_10085 [Erysipelotrichaceae bacterium]|nr:hypothetical protein [Erysipelotrichaceae bacterium]
MMKKLLSILLCGVMALTLAGCSSNNTTTTNSVILMSENDLLSLDFSQTSDGIIDLALADSVDVSADVTTLGVTAIDDKTLQVELESSCAFFEALLAFPSFFPLNEEFVESCGDLLAEYEVDYNIEKAQAYIDAGLAELGVDEITITMLYGTDKRLMMLQLTLNKHLVH